MSIRTYNFILFSIVGMFSILSAINPHYLWAAPSVSSVSGALSNGQTITVTGSGFGTTGPNIVLFDDFEKGTNGNTIPIGEGSAQIGHWDIKGSGPASQSAYSNTYKNSGNLSWATDWYCPTCGTEDGPNNFRQITLPNATDVYVSHWMYVPVGWVYPGAGPPDIAINWKTFWMWDSAAGFGASDVWTVYNADWAWHLGCSSDFGDCSGRISLNEPDSYPHVIPGQWSRWEIYAKGRYTSNGNYTFWVTDATHPRYAVQDVTGRTLSNASHTYKTISMAPYARPQPRSGTVHDSINYQDDIYIATGPGARARVEIGNQSTYANCTNLAVSTVTSWADGSITATVRQGSLANGSAYLFVIDSNGNVSNGYSITIGGASRPDPPTNLRIIN